MPLLRCTGISYSGGFSLKSPVYRRYVQVIPIWDAEQQGSSSATRYFMYRMFNGPSKALGR